LAVQPNTQTQVPSRHRFHGLCPFFAMFPETFVEKWISRVTSEADTVLDPFCGRGTAPFQAILMGRDSVACDINPVAYCITRAKTNPPSQSAVRRRLTLLEKGFDAAAWESCRRRLPRFFHLAYTPGTLRQILCLRSQLHWRSSDTDCMIAALCLGALHGESQKSASYLSNQMPRTISTKPAYSIRFWQKHGYKAPERDVFDLLRRRLDYRYESPLPAKRADVHLDDMRNLPHHLRKRQTPIRCVITSPPYLDVTSFEEDQWLRLWFLGSESRPTYGRISRDDRHERREAYWGFIMDMWRMLGQILAPASDIILRIGGKGFNPDEIVTGLYGTTLIARRHVELIDQEVSFIQRRQTDSFRPGSRGCRFEVDCHFKMR